MSAASWLGRLTRRLGRSDPPTDATPADEPFHRAVLDAPDEDAPRLVYADWLDEHGRPERAEFIRTQIELAKTTDDDPRRPGLERREAELLARHDRAWAGPVARLVDDWTFSRGFVGGVTLRIDRLALAGAGLERLAPVNSLRLLGPGLGLWDFFDYVPGVTLSSPYLARLNHLEIWRIQLRRQGCDGLFFSPLPDRLRSLHLTETGLGTLEASVLATSPYFGQIERLGLHGNMIDDAGLEALSASPCVGRLTTLDLSGNLSGSPIGPRSVRVLGRFASLCELNLSRFGLQSPGRKAAAVGRAIGWLARGQPGQGLNALRDGMGPAGLGDLMQAPFAPQLVRLGLGNNNLRDEGAVMLAACTNLGRLRELDLSKNGIGPAGADRLAASGNLPALRKLDLRGNPLHGAEGARVIRVLRHRLGDGFRWR